MNTLLQVPDVWVPNLVSSGIVVAILSYFLKRYITSNDKRIDAIENEAKQIKNNYLGRFEKVNETISRSKEEIVDRVSNRLNEVEKDLTDYRIKQADTMGRIESNIENLAKYCSEIIKR